MNDFFIFFFSAVQMTDAISDTFPFFFFFCEEEILDEL